MEHVSKAPLYLGQELYDIVSRVLAKSITDLPNNLTAVVSGFIGPVPGSLLKCIGRGYTDLTSALLAKGLQAKKLTIWKEVAGIYSADPTKVEDAKLLHEISPEEAAELTYYGAEVINPFTMRQVTQSGVSIQIRNVRDPTSQGTMIHNEASHSKCCTDESAVAVTLKEGISILNITSRLVTAPQLFFAEIFTLLNQHGVIVDLISTSRVNLSMAIPADHLSDALIRDLQKIGIVSRSDGLSILSLIGQAMRRRIGISAQMFTTLAATGVNIEMISQGASEINISCVISSENSLRALCAIHSSLLQPEI
ncbi:Aspartate kinase [Paramicrosporidium saccamoebae]|uniref:Aspartokinase n=1 Tax=Paramicrosporidium saccamoebae TaxID=1246581 RepID=A0A2H9TGS9_9FUNG|nr:Aspartate kinase [Paramicrosporidium saccamoebae]